MLATGTQAAVKVNIKIMKVKSGKNESFSSHFLLFHSSSSLCFLLLHGSLVARKSFWNDHIFNKILYPLKWRNMYLTDTIMQCIETLESFKKYSFPEIYEILNMANSSGISSIYFTSIHLLASEMRVCNIFLLIWEPCYDFRLIHVLSGTGFY